MIDTVLPFLLGLAASAATIAGGYLALRFRRRLNLIMALTAGIVLGVALFELIPEALNLARDGSGPRFVLSCVAGGFAILLALDRLLQMPHSGGAHLRRHLAPASLTLHSLVDGAGIALAFRLSPEVGWSVAIAVLSHDLADGVNIVGTTLSSGSRRSAKAWLGLNGLAPLLGVASTYVFTIPPSLLVGLLSALGGAFLYIGASELLPKSHRADRRIGTTATSALGFALVYFGTRFA